MEIGDIVDVTAATHNYSFTGVIKKVYGNTGAAVAEVISSPGAYPIAGNDAYITSTDIVMELF